MPEISFLDGRKKNYPSMVSGADIALSISRSLLKEAVAIKKNGVLCDLNDNIDEDCAVEIVKRTDPDALELIRHDAAHVMAEAVQELYPETQVTIGPFIQDGFYYDFAREESFNEDDFARIEKKMYEIIARNEKFVKEVWDRQKAIDFFKAKNEHYKVELIEGIDASQEISVYKQGQWLDLCRGPHMPSTGKIGKAFKLLKVAGAYWRGDSRNVMLQRIYATAWASQEDLQLYLERIELAKQRDHRRLGMVMDLFHLQDDAPGSVFWHQKGWTFFQTLVDYIRHKQNSVGYIEVNTPDMLDRSLWEKSGHWEKFSENMFISQTEDERIFALKPMNCPGHVQIFKNGTKSYRDLPVKIAEFGKVHRYEPSGALHGIMRVRSFTQDDAHVFCTTEQITQECINVNTLILDIYKDFGFNDVIVKFADRPEKRVGSDEVWQKSEDALLFALKTADQEYIYNKGEGAFYGPKLEYTLRDSIGREWQCGTLQVDLNLPGRLGANFINPQGDKERPVMLHRAIFGSIERFIGILIEHTGGNLPLWLAPIQIIVCTITSNADNYAQLVCDCLKKNGLRVDLDMRNEKISYKIREHSLAKIPIIVICGNKEAEEQTLSFRRLGSEKQSQDTLNNFVEIMKKDALSPLENINSKNTHVTS